MSKNVSTTRFSDSRNDSKKSSFQSVIINAVDAQGPYEPYDNRKVKKPITNMETFVNLLKSSLGTGILAMPNAFSHSGYGLGIVGTVVIATVCTYCVHILIRTGHEICKRRRIPSLTYPEIAVASLEEGPGWCKRIAPFGGIISTAFLIIFQLGISCVYVMFIAENLKKVIDQHIEHPIDLKIYMLAILIPLILINLVRNLKLLAPFAQIANLATFAGFGIILYYLFRDSLSTEGKVPVGDVKEFPLFFGTVMFSLEAVGMMLPLENDMKTPKDFVGYFGILNRAMSTITILYSCIGLVGYIRFGSEALGSITLNLPSHSEILPQVVQILLAFAMYITHGLACYVAIDLTWNHHLKKYFHNKRTRIIFEFIVRIGLVMVTFTLAISVPALGSFISLTGAFCISQLALVFPAIFETSTFWYHISSGRRILMVFKNCILVVVGIVGLIIGTYTSIIEISKDLAPIM